MTYIVMEMQTTNGSTAIVPPMAYADRNAAESRFHQILTAAALSAVEEHAAVMITSDGRMLRNECYRHYTQPATDDSGDGE